MAIAWGVVLALLACGLAAWSGMDRDRAFYPTLLIVIATYYVLFAVEDGGTSVLVSEVALASVFGALALAAFRRQPWLVIAGLAAHALLDLFHDHLVRDTGVPPFWPGFCMAFDLTAAVLVGCASWARRRA